MRPGSFQQERHLGLIMLGGQCARRRRANVFGDPTGLMPDKLRLFYYLRNSQ